MKNITYLFLAFILVFSSCAKEEEIPAQMSVLINIENRMNGKSLELEGLSYTLPSGEEFTPKKFKYFITNIQLSNSVSGEIFSEENSYHLISEGGNKTIDLGMIPSSSYDKIKFSFGVDEVSNAKIDQTGDLDPNSDMAWSWKTGYKFVVLQGEYLNSVTSERAGLVMHIGTNENYRVVNQNLTDVAAGKATTITLMTNVDELFVNPNALNISELPSATIMFGPLAAEVADNYAEGFVTVK
jgi:hypothetical protein